MLKPAEKAYCRGLAALKEREYITADKEFQDCQNYFADNKRMIILFEATRALALLKNGHYSVERNRMKIKEKV
jgi:hypothetical protein